MPGCVCGRVFAQGSQVGAEVERGQGAADLQRQATPGIPVVYLPYEREEVVAGFAAQQGVLSAVISSNLRMDEILGALHTAAVHM